MADNELSDTYVEFAITPQLPGGQKVPWEEIGVAVDGPSEVKDLAIREQDGKVLNGFIGIVDDAGRY